MKKQQTNNFIPTTTLEQTYIKRSINKIAQAFHLTKRSSLIVAVLLCLVSLVVPFQTSSAEASGRVVFVETFGVRTWPVKAAMDFINVYTGTNLVFGRCLPGYECIKVHSQTINSNWAAVTYGDTIYVNPQRNWYSWTAKKNILVHELGHTRGIWYHDASCYYVMYYSVFCPNGSLPGLRFTAKERAILAAH